MIYISARRHVRLRGQEGGCLHVCNSFLRVDWANRCMLFYLIMLEVRNLGHQFVDSIFTMICSFLIILIINWYKRHLFFGWNQFSFFWWYDFWWAVIIHFWSLLNPQLWHIIFILSIELNVLIFETTSASDSSHCFLDASFVLVIIFINWTVSDILLNKLIHQIWWLPLSLN